MMKTINIGYIHYLQIAYVGTVEADFASDDCHFPSAWDSNSETMVKSMIRGLVLPHYESSCPVTKSGIKISLMFILTRCSMNDPKYSSKFFAWLIEDAMAIFPPPDPAEKFFIWVWEVLFPNESYLLPNSDDYLVKETIIYR